MEGFNKVWVEPANLPWRLSACAWVAPADGPRLREQLRTLMPRNSKICGLARTGAIPPRPPRAR